MSTCPKEVDAHQRRDRRCGAASLFWLHFTCGVHDRGVTGPLGYAEHELNRGRGALSKDALRLNIRARSLSGHPLVHPSGKPITAQSQSHRIHKDTPERTPLKPNGESQISRYPDGKGPLC
jgi:hypothetical protein